VTSKPSFEELLLQGALNAVRTLTLDELYAQVECLNEMNMPDDIAEFPRAVLEIVISEKRLLRALN
jgi:hypothetical protein